MMQNSLDRLFVGMASTLHERVLPAVDDPAVAAQVRAMVELLGNLSTRVTWDPAHLDEVRSRLHVVLDELSALDDAPVTASPRLADADEPDTAEADVGEAGAGEAGAVRQGDVEALRREVVDDLARLADGQMWLATRPEHVAVRRAVDEFVDWYLDQEGQRLRSARFGRP